MSDKSIATTEEYHSRPQADTGRAASDQDHFLSRTRHGDTVHAAPQLCCHRGTAAGKQLCRTRAAGVRVEAETGRARSSGFFLEPKVSCERRCRAESRREAKATREFELDR